MPEWELYAELFVSSYHPYLVSLFAVFLSLHLLYYLYIQSLGVVLHGYVSLVSTPGTMHIHTNITTSHTSTGESPHGPVVKQILDHPRCAQLREGDIILKVNGEKVNSYKHSDVVTVFKRCVKGDPANFTILRQAPQQAEVGGTARSSFIDHYTCAIITAHCVCTLKIPSSS